MEGVTSVKNALSVSTDQLLKGTVKTLRNMGIISRWPRPRYNPADQPHFLFLLTPPNSGSTALADLLSSSPYVTKLTSNSEGQWLIPELCKKEDRWSEHKVVNYESVKAVWLHRYQSHRHSPKERIVIEKSPTNMVRSRALMSIFKSASLLINNRNPYAQCASRLRRYNRDIEDDSLDIERVLAGYARDWQRQSGILKTLAQELNAPCITYEEFCANPAILQDRLEIEGYDDLCLDYEKKVRVKDYKPQRISNQNDRQIASLPKAGIAAISDVLAKKPDLLEYFGYGLRN